MEYSKLIEERFSVRKFKDEKVSRDDLNVILHAGHVAPTGCNNQLQRIYAIESEEALEKLKVCTKCHFDAPMALLVCYNKNEVWRRKYDGKSCGVADASIVTNHMMLAAHNIGVGSTWVMHFDPQAMVKEFDLPENIIPVALLVMGYPADDAAPIEMHYQKRPLEEVIIYK